MSIKQKTIELIDALKATCQTYGMGNDGNEYKIITQVFLYKFLNDKFGHEIKQLNARLKNAKKWELEYKSMSEKERLDLFDKMSPDVPRLYPEHLIFNLWNQQSKGDFDLIFDNTMTDIAEKNIDIFSTMTDEKTRIPLFEKLTIFVTDDAKRAPFARALVDKLANFSFEEAFNEHYDFFATIFEYLIKDYNTAGGGKYAEYYTPHSIATIMARLLVGETDNLHDIEVYDPSAGTGTLLMALAHKVGEDKCTIYSQDISQRSNKMLKLNLILNNLVSSLDHAIQGDTLVAPFHKTDDGKEIRQFDYVVSNPPFKMDFTDTRDTIAAMSSRFWAGVPKIPGKDLDQMAIYTCFVQHVINSIKSTGKGAVVVPTGFLTAKGIEQKIREKLVHEKWLRGAISMPANIFANTGTNVSVIFIDKTKQTEKPILIDASQLGEKYKEDNIQKTFLREFETQKIIDTFENKREEDGFSILVSFEELESKKCSFSAAQYFETIVETSNYSQEEYNEKINQIKDNLDDDFSKAVASQLKNIAKTIFDYWFVQFDFPDKDGKPYRQSGGKMVYNDFLKREIPEGWDVGNLYSIAEFVNGLACQKYRPIDENKKYPVIKITEMHEGFTDSTEYVRDTVPSKYIIHNGDILFSWSASLETLIWNNGTGCLNQHIFKVNPKGYSKYYVYLQLSSYIINFVRMAAARKTTMGHITTDHLNQSKIVLPPIELVEKFEEEVRKIYKEVYDYQDTNHILKALCEKSVKYLL